MPPVRMGCYTLHLYCACYYRPGKVSDKYYRGFGEFTGPSGRRAMNEARKAGWKIVANDSEGQDICPDCRKESQVTHPTRNGEKS